MARLQVKLERAVIPCQSFAVNEKNRQVLVGEGARELEVGRGRLLDGATWLARRSILLALERQANAQKTNAVTARCWMLAGADRRRRFKSSLFRRAFRQRHQKRQMSMDYGAKFFRGRLFILRSFPRKRESGAGTVVAPRVTDRRSLGNLRG